METLITKDELERFAVPRRANIDPEFIQNCCIEATELVRAAAGNAKIPNSIMRRAALEVGKNLVSRKAGIDGATNFDGESLEPLRITRDPLQAARSFLAPYTGPAIA